MLTEISEAEVETNNQPISQNNQLYLSEYGTAGKCFALGVKGDNRFRQETENLLVNYGVIGTTASYHPLYDGFGYFVLEIQKLEFALIDYCRNMYWMANRAAGITWDNILQGAGRYLYQQQAKKMFDSIIRENFMQNQIAKEVHFYFNGLVKK